MDDSKLLEEIKNITGISDLEHLTPADVEKILKHAGESNLKQAHLAARVKIFPDFASMTREALKVQIALIGAIKGTEGEAIAVMRAAIDGLSKTLQLLAAGAQSDDTRAHIANCAVEVGKLFVDIARMNQDLGAQRINMWKHIAMSAGAVVLTLVGALGTVYISNRSDDPKA